jgi:hypothetical protein
MPTDDQARHHPYLIPSGSTWVPRPAIATRQASRKEEPVLHRVPNLASRKAGPPVHSL